MFKMYENKDMYFSDNKKGNLSNTFLGLKWESIVKHSLSS